MAIPAKVFISYSHEDHALCVELAKHLLPLQREGLIESWGDVNIPPGGDFDSDITRELETADIIILAVSPDFIASEYCWGKEMSRALERHKLGCACVVPVIMRPVDWHSSPFGGLKALPRDGKPVVRWENQDEGLLDVARSLRGLVEKTAASPPLSQINENTYSPESADRAGGMGLAHLSLQLGSWWSFDPKFQVLIDQKLKGEVRANRASGVRVEPGIHVIQIRRMWAVSNELTTTIKPGEDVVLLVDNRFKDAESPMSQRLLAVYGMGHAFAIKRI